MQQHYRATWHDYKSRCIYMVTIPKNPLTPGFGNLEGDCSIPLGKPGAPTVRFSRIGKVILRALLNFKEIEPRVRILQFSIMPDHLHLLLFVEQTTEEILGRIIARFKVTVNEAAGIEKVFGKGFNDQILHPSRSLDVLFNYLRDNPRRLLVRRAYPQYFQRVNDLRIGEGSYKAYGNMQLLGNPFREQVVVHRADSPATRSECLDRWLYTAANGGVLVSPFISPDEKAVRDRAEALDGKMIIITDKPMPERFKPAGSDFDRCVAGRLLIISMPPQPGATMRQHCLAMNALALQIASL